MTPDRVCHLTNPNRKRKQYPGGAVAPAPAPRALPAAVARGRPSSLGVGPRALSGASDGQRRVPPRARPRPHPGTHTQTTRITRPDTLVTHSTQKYAKITYLNAGGRRKALATQIFTTTNTVSFSITRNQGLCKLFFTVF